MFKYLTNVRKLDLNGAADGTTNVDGDILPVQILKSKLLPEEQNLFLKDLRRGNDAAKMSEIMMKYDELVGLNTKNVYIDKLIQANTEA